ncbi:glycosyltransferase family 2 protein [Pontibacter vulgaris]|uniref:glycosyltransferase family 2 protein n=1 Tax=Pontibacter vulgaris TaxID=2905679 RepID=UPI001FA7221F|nr:glycosyltransferase family 2 protein [Pontibacter vulgaris]
MLDKLMFSIIIPVHNKLPHLERSVNSVLNQTYTYFELILVNDASTDGSAEKIKKFQDPRIKILNRDTPGAGGYAARNLGIKHAAYEWICFLDADDEWELTLLETIAAVININSDVEIVSWGWYKVCEGKKAIDTYSTLNKNYSIKNFTLIDFLIGPQQIWTGAVCIKKDLIIKAGGFPESKFKRGGDMDTWTRCLWHSNHNLWINKAMSFYHIDSVNMVTKSIKRDSEFIFSPFLEGLLKTVDDKHLKKAIKYYQNRYLYIMLNGRVYEGESINYNLLRKMNFNNQALWLIIKLHLNRIRLKVAAL